MKRSGIFLILTGLILTTSCSSSGDESSTPPSEINYYRITWKNYDGTVLETDRRVRENTVPTYDGSAPTKPEDSSYTYSWSGWTPKVVAATSDATYTATFASTPKGGGDPEKVIVAKHTLKDTNPPFDSDNDGERVSESTWNAFRSASQSEFKKNYNYTYEAYSGGTYTLEYFTKNGYYVSTSAGTLYYERKNSTGNTFYEYISTKDGYLRQETSLDLESKYTYRIHHEIYVHMFDYNEYEYMDGLGGVYTYNESGVFSSQIKFQNGYLSSLTYILYSTMSKFEIKLAFKTEIEIPKSYYYK